LRTHAVRLTHLLRPYWKRLTVAFAAMLVESGADLLEPWPLKIIFDYVIGTKAMPAWLAAGLPDDIDRITLLNLAALSVIAIAGAGAIGSYGERYLSATVGTRVGYDLRHLLYHHVQRLSLSFYEQRRTGDMVVRLTSDIDAVESFITSAVLAIALDLVTLAGLLCVTFYLDWRFSLIALSTAPFLFMLVYRFMGRIKQTARDVKKKEGELASVVQESISSARLVKAFAREDYEERRLDRESEETVGLMLRARGVKAILAPLVDIVVAVGTCLVLWYGVRLVLDGRLTAGALLVFILYLGKMYKPMKNLSKMTDTLSKAAVAFERIGELLAVEGCVRDLPGARTAPPFEGQIALAHVRFAYGRNDCVLRDVSLSVERGQRAALVGLTGAGKSTIVGLISRLYDVLDGAVLIDGRDVRSYTLQSLRQQVSVVLQDTVLFHASIADNIAYGRPDATREDVSRAATLANVDEFVARMPRGYDTVVGERGETLSGGQRQRIAIARAIIRNAPILLLDEPSAALDPESEALVFDGLTRLMHGRTSLTIAHRMATIRNADVIFMLDRGVIAESGTHDELVARNALYARFSRGQYQPAPIEVGGNARWVDDRG
jgi:subfamily B ATP-binding cassette protein MsbA